VCVGLYVSNWYKIKYELFQILMPYFGGMGVLSTQLNLLSKMTRFR
jgi:hypothetical protein